MISDTREQMFSCFHMFSDTLSLLLQTIIYTCIPEQMHLPSYILITDFHVDYKKSKLATVF
jgi:hypothetical protein